MMRKTPLKTGTLKRNLELGSLFYKNGIISVNETRALFGLGPIEEQSIEVMSYEEHARTHRFKHESDDYYTCEYCGVTTEGTTGLCPQCGAPKTPHSLM